MAKALQNLFIIGVHRSGTSSLFTYLKQFPEVVPSRVKELHFFTPIRYNKPLNNSIDYHSLFLKSSKSSRYYLEASPSYFYGGEAIQKSIEDTVGKSYKCILILRNPVDRFISFYRHAIYTNSIEEQALSVFIERSIEALDKPVVDAIYSRSIREGFYIDYLKDWEPLFKRQLKLIFFDELTSNSVAALDELKAWLAISKSTNLKLEKLNDSRGFKSSLIHDVALKIQASFDSTLNKSERIKRKLRGVYNQINTEAANAENFEVERNILESFYRDKNKELSSYLKEKNLVDSFPAWLEIQND